MQRKKDIKKKITKVQINVLCTFFEENPELVVGYKKTQTTIKAVTAKWQMITPHLNSLGAQKKPSQWSTYLRNHKNKLKLKRFKWKQNRNGNGPIICNAEDFDEIGFRMLQVLRRNASEPHDHDSQNSNTSCRDSEDNVKAESKYKLETIVIKQETNKDDSNDGEEAENTQATTTEIFVNSNEETPQVFVNSNDEGHELDIFARNVAQELRALPLDIALETQEIMRSVMFKQRLKVLNDVGDPLDKKSS